MTLGQKITKIRKEKKLSQIDVAKFVGVSRDAISKYERDDIIPSVENAKKIAQVLNVSLDYLVSEDGNLEVVDVTMVNRMKEIQRLNNDDKSTIVKIIDAFIRDTKTKKAYS
ncbi:helix-turn-helix domain-containing protein [Tenacibaculum sp. C7A-26P2]|uniref:helix-turn-helix domain-containing protein n=1 Tax=Tenacibaculum sp. C7A-26P2 TaxID=3447504 RepID=UPI003F85EFEE